MTDASARFEQGAVREPIFGNRLWVVDAGPEDGEPLVLLHGLGDDGPGGWAPLIPSLARTRRVIAPDLPGFARSSHAGEAYTPDRYAELVSWLAAERLGRPFDLAGHSLGASVALLLAGTHPESVRRLLLVDAAGILHRQAYAEQLAYFGVDSIPGIDSIPGLEQLLSEAAGGLLGKLLHGWMRPLTRLEPEPAALLEIGAVRSKLLGGDPVKIAAIALILKNFGEAIDGVRAGPLIVWGAEDRIAPPRTGKLLRSRIEGARLELIPGCGHVPMQEAAPRFEQLLDEWLEAPLPADAERQAPSPPGSGRVERLRGERNPRLSGEYERVEIESCRGALLAGVRARSIAVRDSDIEIEETCLLSEGVALEARGSRARVTGGTIEGECAIVLDRSDADLAGVRIAGRRAAVRAGESEQACDALFSVCPVSAPGLEGHLHGIHRIRPGHGL
ncbi:MAG: alpha/beta hydrolase [Polyangia bacterium]